MWSGPWQQWPLQQSMYQNVPHDQVDWAALAKQWIQLQHVHKSEVRPPNPMPGHPVMPLPVHEPMPIPPQMHPPAVVKIPLLSDPIIPPEPPRIDTVSHVESKVQHESYLPPDTKESNFWPGRWDDDAKVVSNDSWPQPPPPAEDSYDFGHMHGNQHLQAQSYDYNHGSDHYGYNQDFSSDVDYSQYWIDQSSTELPPFVRQEKKQRSSDAPLLHSEQDSIQAGQLDAAKRKTLPAWIREGLEKMERQKQKKMESSKQTVGKPPAPPLEEELTGDAISRAKIFIDAEKSRFESESEGEDEVRKESSRELSPAIEKYSAPSPITENLTDEERRQEVMLRVRRLLTEILLGVTNEEISAVAKEVYQRALSKAPARQLVSSSALASIASGLGGLADYGSEEESDEGESDSDYELDQKIREKQKAFAVREREIVAMLDQEEAAEKLRLKGKQDVASSEPNVKKLATESIPEPSSNRPNMESTEKPAAEDIKIEPAEKPTNQDSKESIPQVAAGSKSRDTSTSKSPDSDSSSSSSSSTSSSSLGKRKKKSGGGTKRKPRESRKRKRSSSRESDRGSSRKSYRGKRSRSRDTGSRKVRRRSPDRSSRRRRSRSAEKHRHGASSSRKRSRSRSPDRSKRHRSRSRDRDSKYKSRSKAKPRSRSKSPKRSRTNRERSHSPKSKKRQSRSSSSESERSDRKKSGGKK